MPWEILATSGDADELREAFGRAAKLVHEARTAASYYKKRADEEIEKLKAGLGGVFGPLEEWAAKKKGFEARLRNLVELHYLGTGDRNPWPGLGIRDTEKEECEFTAEDAVVWITERPDMYWLLDVRQKQFATYVLGLPETARERMGLNEFVEFTTVRKVTATIAKDLEGKV